MASSGMLLITGGLGYVGGRVAAYLSESEPRLSIRLTTHRSDASLPLWARKMEVVRADLLEESSLAASLDGIDTVVHLAAVNEIESHRDPDLALEANSRGTHRLLRACVDRGVERFIYFSTFHVYGPEARQPITEETPTRPVHPYAFTHRLAEDYVNWYRHSHGMNTLILRLSNGYGYPADPHVQRWSLVFNDFCLQAVKHREIRLRSRGSQHRDFVPLTDVARGVRHFLSLPQERWDDGLFNFGGDCSMSIFQVAERVADEYRHCYGRTIPVTTADVDEGQLAGPVVFSSDKLRRTGFALAGNMSEEIQRTFEVCEQLVHQRAEER